MAEITRTEAALEAAMARFSGDPERVEALDRARRFKRSWIDLAEVLSRVRDSDSFTRWGFSSFEDYCTRELRLKRATVDKLCVSYGFLRANAPKLARAQVDPDGGDDAPVPSWQAVDFVARAEKRGAAAPEVLDEMKREVFESGTPMPVLSKRYREVAFPLADDERKDKTRGQIVVTARKLADLVSEPVADLPDGLAERVEHVLGELQRVLGTRRDAVPAAA